MAPSGRFPLGPFLCVRSLAWACRGACHASAQPTGPDRGTSRVARAPRPCCTAVVPQAPYLYFALNEEREMLVLSIGLGVGVAAIVGTLRFVRG